ncbi:MAG: hypothetical protein HOB37_18625 [Rhodospirillaceae bacterium]|jgi:hypothetical protein|nr:hypothetical protein [Rhodospirillaceae bacterium]MBT5191968.1 hypothetical protein [Rhodospirillaceae bacterium]MBT6610454.1 hypothetical protein [Rhodospirillaceae bacterium]
MKFLMFNVVVIGALAYLVVGPGGADFFKSDTAQPVPVAAKEDIAAKAKALYDEVYAKRMNEAEKFFSMVDKETPEDETKRVAAAEPKPAVQEAVPAPNPKPVKKAPVLTAAKEIPVVAVHKAPPPAQPVGTGKAIVTASKTEPAPAPKFMTPRQRARELNRLVQDMEIFFADKLAN